MVVQEVVQYAEGIESEADLYAELGFFPLELLSRDLKKAAEELTASQARYFVDFYYTWQEARKIFNKSPYLKNLPRAQIKPRQASQYQLRRNQPEGGLCTAECVVEILIAKNHIDIAGRLDAAFGLFNSKLQ